jgi:hypothetical protein
VWVSESGARRTVAARAGKVRKRPSPRKSANREMVCMAVGRFFENPIQNVLSENQNGPTNPVPHTSACQERGGYMRGKKKKEKKSHSQPPTGNRPQQPLHTSLPVQRPSASSVPQRPPRCCRPWHTPSWGDRPARPGALPGGDLTVASAPNRT